MLRKIIRVITYIIYRTIYRTEFINSRNVPLKGPLILYSNHLSNHDPFLIGCAVKQKIYFMAKEELFKNKFMRNIITFLGAFPVKRGSGDIAAIKTSLIKLRNKKILFMFPEGTRRKGDRPLKAKPGIAMLAIKAKCPVLPVTILNKTRIFRKNKVIFGTPIDLSQYYDKELSTSEYGIIAENLMKEVYKLMEAYKN